MLLGIERFCPRFRRGEVVAARCLEVLLLRRSFFYPFIRLIDKIPYGIQIISQFHDLCLVVL